MTSTKTNRNRMLIAHGTSSATRKMVKVPQNMKIVFSEIPGKVLYSQNMTFLYNYFIDLMKNNKKINNLNNETMYSGIHGTEPFLVKIYKQGESIPDLAIDFSDTKFQLGIFNPVKKNKEYSYSHMYWYDDKKSGGIKGPISQFDTDALDTNFMQKITNGYTEQKNVLKHKMFHYNKPNTTLESVMSSLNTFYPNNVVTLYVLTCRSYSVSNKELTLFFNAENNILKLIQQIPSDEYKKKMVYAMNEYKRLHKGYKDKLLSTVQYDLKSYVFNNININILDEFLKNNKKCPIEKLTILFLQKYYPICVTKTIIGNKNKLYSCARIFNVILSEISKKVTNVNGQDKKAKLVPLPKTVSGIGKDIYIKISNYIPVNKRKRNKVTAQLRKEKNEQPKIKKQRTNEGKEEKNNVQKKEKEKNYLFQTKEKKKKTTSKRRKRKT